MHNLLAAYLITGELALLAILFARTPANLQSMNAFGLIVITLVFIIFWPLFFIPWDVIRGRS